MSDYRKYGPVDKSDYVFYINSVVDDTTVSIQCVIKLGNIVEYREECDIIEAILIAIEHADIRNR